MFTPFFTPFWSPMWPVEDDPGFVLPWLLAGPEGNLIDFEGTILFTDDVVF